MAKKLQAASELRRVRLSTCHFQLASDLLIDIKTDDPRLDSSTQLAWCMKMNEHEQATRRKAMRTT